VLVAEREVDIRDTFFVSDVRDVEGRRCLVGFAWTVDSERSQAQSLGIVWSGATKSKSSTARYWVRASVGVAIGAFAFIV